MTAVRVLGRTETAGRTALTLAVCAAIESAMVWRFGWSTALPAHLYFGAIAALVSVADLFTRRVPNRVVLPAYVVGPALLALPALSSGRWVPLLRAGLAMGVLAGFFLLLAMVSRGGIGLGDCKWAGIVGLYLGWIRWSALVDGTLLAFLAASFFVVRRRAVHPHSSTVLLPFAPFMAGGALMTVFIVR